MWRLKLYRGRWYAVSRDGGNTKRVALRTSNRDEAERRLKDQLSKPVGDTVGPVMDAYLKEKEGRARSYQSMLTAWRSLKPVFAHLRPDQIDRKLCRDYAVRRRKQGVKDGTVIKDLGVLRAALKWAGKTGAVFALPHTPPPRERYLTKDEVDALIEACDLPHIRLFVMLAWATGGRASAILDLTWDRVDFERGIVRLQRPEGRRKGRANVPVGERTIEALRAAYEARESDCVIEWGGKPVKNIARAFARVAEKAGLEDCSPHVLRHSSAVRMAEAGVPLTEIAAFLGHTDPRVTFRVYARFSPEYLRKAASALE